MQDIWYATLEKGSFNLQINYDPQIQNYSSRSENQILCGFVN